MLTLYAARGTVALAPHIALEETGLPHRIIWLDFATADQRAPDYLAVNPKGRVPALSTEDGTLTETPAILEFIAERSGQLMPDTPFARARVREMMGFLAATLHVNHAHGPRASRWSDDPAAQASMAAKVPRTMAESCAWVEEHLPASGWSAGPYSVADMHLFATSRWLAGDGVDIQTFPKLAAHAAAMQARPAVARATSAHG